MSTYRVEWSCCGSVTETESWEPEHCPFCHAPSQPEAAAVSEPVAYSIGRTLHWHPGRGINDAQLYAAPPQREPYDQTALGLCNACGWKAVGPDGCLNCAPQREPQWVPVAERLPEKFTEVLVAFAGQMSIASTGQYTNSPHDTNGWCYPAENNGICDDGSDPVVTHWIPLPDAPASAPKEQA